MSCSRTTDRCNARNTDWLYDTFGTPRDLIRVGMEERGFELEEEEFNQTRSMALCKSCNSRRRWKKLKAKAKTNPAYADVAARTGQFSVQRL